LLDEPTNHLDLEMRQALAVALQDYEGAVVLVSHDRHLLRTVADELMVVHGGRATPFDGDLEDYAKWLDETAGAAARAAAGAGFGADTGGDGRSGGADTSEDGRRGGADSGGDGRRGADASGNGRRGGALTSGGGSGRRSGDETGAAQSQSESAEARKQRKREEAERRNRLTPLKAKIAKFDAELARLATRSAELQRELAAPDIYSAGAKDRLKELLAQQAQVVRETEKVEEAWLEASEELEEQSRELG
jgi:ATP-binding cassette subfamily F protein 3